MFTKVFILIKYTKLLWFPSASCFLTVQQWQLFGRLQLLPSTSILMSSNLWWSNFISTIIMLTFLWSSFFYLTCCFDGTFYGFLIYLIIVNMVSLLPQEQSTFFFPRFEKKKVQLAAKCDFFSNWFCNHYTVFSL